MSGYKRFITYIYRYEEGEKRESAGFVKVNARDGECKFWVHINGDYARSGQPCRVYAFMRKKERLLGQQLGELEVRNGALEWNGVTEEERLMGGSFGLEESGGLYIEGENLSFAAAWDELPVLPERFEPEKRFARQAVEQADSGDEIQAAELELEHREPASEEEGETVVEAVVEAEKPEEPDRKDVLQEPKADARKEQWEYLADHFPVMRYVEGDGAEVFCIRLSNQDLARVPRDKWGLGNNSFLLHGFYQYHHLLLLRRQAGDEVCYYIGVPGIYNEREQMIADTFGFHEFKVMKGIHMKRSGMGYWCRKLQ